MTDLDTLCINTIRMLSVDMVEKANSGHPGMPMGAAPMAYTIWTKFMRFNPKNPLWPDRDRFVLSAGHGSALLYSMLYLTGYDAMTIGELKCFRQWGSATPGHPERAPAHGVEVTTGPLGQGFANGVGMAIAERHLAARFNRPGHEIVNHYTYALVSDGDLMEGIASEAASIAGHLKLGRLVYLYDDNRITLSSQTKITFTEDVGRRFEAYGWHVQKVGDGNDVEALGTAIEAARVEGARPSIIMVRTHIGYGSPHVQDSYEAHGSPLGGAETAATKKKLGWPLEPDFFVPGEALTHFRETVGRGAGLEAGWDARMKAYADAYPDLKRQWDAFMSGALPDGWEGKIPAYTPDHKPIATRSAGKEIINSVESALGNLIGGSADLDPSTKTALTGRGSFQSPDVGDDSVQGSEKGAWAFGSANIYFGVREHAMGGILNGIAAHGGLVAFGSTFLIFSDYMRPAIRLAALSGLKVIYVFTHDSVMLGEDGPTHQPVEHLSNLRAMPGLTVIRPADAGETAEAWKAAVSRRDGPVALILTRQDLKVVDRTRYAPAGGLLKGAYVLADSGAGRPELIIIATGSEVNPALEAYERLSAEGVRARVVSMPSWELFEEQTEGYRDFVLPPDAVLRVSVEAGSSHGWHKHVGTQGVVIGIDRFGASAPGDVNRGKFGFTADNIVERARRLLEGGAA